METGQLTSQASEEERVPPPGLHRLVTGQLTEQDSQVEVTLIRKLFVSLRYLLCICFKNIALFFACFQVATPPPGLDRMIPGQITEGAGPRMVPGRMNQDDDDDDDNDLPSASRNPARNQNPEHSSNLRRMVPGQTDSQV